MNNQEKAIKNFNTMNCNQSVLAVYGPDYGIPEETCFQLGLSYGGGMGKQGKTCGAVTGAYTVIGLWSAQQSNDQMEQKKIAVEKVQEFNRIYEKANGGLECKSLLKYDMTNPKDMEIILEKDLFNTLCPKLVANSTAVLDKILS